MLKGRLALLALALVLTGCVVSPLAAPAATPATAVPPTAAPAAVPTPDPVTVTDALGRKVSFSRPPQRVVVVGKALFMIADAIYMFPEAGSRIVAIGSTKQNKLDFIPVIDPNYTGKTILESSAGAEQIAAVKPDLVILKSTVAETTGKAIEAIGIPVVYVDFETPEQYQRDLTTLGQIFRNEARAKELIAFFQQRVDRITKAVANLKEEQKPRVLLMYYSDRDGAIAFNVPPLGWMQTMLVQISGGNPAWKGAQIGSGWTKVTIEQIATWDADQIYIIAYTANIDEVIAKLKADPQWQAMRAVKQGKLYGFPADYYSWDQPDPRWILGLTWMATRVNPDRFPGLDMQQEIRTFYRELYNMDDAAYQKHVQPNLVGDLR